MNRRNNNTTGRRAQAGIGTLIILIAAILVATITVGVFFDIAGLLQGQTTSTSEGVSNQLDSRLEIVSVSGEVSNEAVDRVNVTVKLASDGGAADLRTTTVQWVGSDGVETLTWSGNNGTEPTFELTAFGSSDLVLDNGTERATITINATSFGPALEPGTVVTLSIVTRAELVYRLQIPQTLSGRSTVGL